MSECFFSGYKAKEISMGQFPLIKTDHWQYFLDIGVDSLYSEDDKFDQKHKKACLFETVKLNRAGRTPLWVHEALPHHMFSNNEVFEIKNYRDKKIVHTDKELNILKLILEKTEQYLDPFVFVEFKIDDIYFLEISSEYELAQWIINLEKKNLVSIGDKRKKIEESNLRFNAEVKEVANSLVQITPQGRDYIKSKLGVIDTKNVFIAKAFTDSEGNEVSNDLGDALKDVLKTLGWNGVIVNEVQYNDGVMDKVFASINESRFILAELTHQKSGVYYEAGYAKGLGLPVIHIVRADELNKCHFDVQHLNLIKWSNLEELKDKLAARIKATIL